MQQTVCGYKVLRKIKIRRANCFIGIANVAFCEEVNLNFYNLNNCDEKRRR